MPTCAPNWAAMGSLQTEARKQSPGSEQGLLLPRLQLACGRCSRKAGPKRPLR